MTKWWERERRGGNRDRHREMEVHVLYGYVGRQHCRPQPKRSIGCHEEPIWKKPRWSQRSECRQRGFGAVYKHVCSQHVCLTAPKLIQNYFFPRFLINKSVPTNSYYYVISIRRLIWKDNMTTYFCKNWLSCFLMKKEKSDI